MKGTSRVLGGTVVAAVTLAVFLGTLSAVDLARAAELPSQLRDKIVRELSDSRVSDQVLENLSKALNDGLPSDTLTAMVDRVMDSGVDPLTLEHLTGALARALEDELPPGPVVAKILEGVAKNVPEDRLVLAVDSVLERLGFAAEVARLASSKDDDRGEFIIRTADAVAAGMDRNRLRSLAEKMAGRNKNNKVSSLQVMEVIKTASGYGIADDRVENVAKALLDDENADESDVKRILRSLVEHDDDRNGNWDGDYEIDDDEDGDHEDGDDEDGDSEDGDSDDGDSEDGDSEDGDMEDKEDGSSEEPEDGEEPEEDEEPEHN